MQVKLYTPPKPKKTTPENIVGNVKDVDGPLKRVDVQDTYFLSTVIVCTVLRQFVHGHVGILLK